MQRTLTLRDESPKINSNSHTNSPGDSPFYFSILSNRDSAQWQFAQMDEDPNISLSAINDDVKEQFEETDAVMRRWFEKRWPIPAAWEAS